MIIDAILLVFGLFSLVAMCVLPWAFLYATIEFHFIQNGYQSYKWAHRLYDRYNLQRFKW